MNMVQLIENAEVADALFRSTEEGFPCPQRKELQPKQDLKKKQFPEKSSFVKKPFWKKSVQQPPQIVVKQGKG